MSLTMPKTAVEAIDQVKEIVEGRYDDYHNSIISSSEYGPERFMALARAHAAQVEGACAVARMLLMKEGLS